MTTAKKSTKKEEVVPVKHGSLLSPKELNTPGESYTYDWNKVTYEPHLKKRYAETEALTDVEKVEGQPAE